MLIQCETRLPQMMARGSLCLALAFWACLLMAQEVAQDWIPPEIRFPEDMQVVVDRAIGSTTRMFSFRTGAEVEALLEEWRSTLEEAGYAVESSEQSILDRQIEFSGSNIDNAKISVAPRADSDQSVIEFDASLRN